MSVENSISLQVAIQGHFSVDKFCFSSWKIPRVSREHMQDHITKKCALHAWFYRYKPTGSNCTGKSSTCYMNMRSTRQTSQKHFAPRVHCAPCINILEPLCLALFRNIMCSIYTVHLKNITCPENIMRAVFSFCPKILAS